MRGKAWVEEEDSYLIKNWEKNNRSFIAKKLGRSEDAIKVRASKLGLKADDLYHLPAHFSSTQLNEYEGLSVADRAYIAGIIDGEGNVYFAKNKNRKDCFDARISIYNCDKNLMTWLEDKIFGSNVYERKHRNGDREKAYVLRVDGTLKVKKLLFILLPFLIIKREISKKIISHKTRYTPEWLNLKEVMLNAREAQSISLSD